MTSTINASSSGSGGIVQTADASGVLALQANGTTAFTVNSDATTTFANAANLPNTFGFKNRIINGGMVIDQRNAGASATPAADTYTLDRWLYGSTVASKFTVQQNAGSVTPPAGFSNYLGATSTSAYSLTGTQSFSIQHRLEGFNTADFNFGTASATNLTLSFWVRSSLTGTFGGEIYGNPSRTYPFTYSIVTANTWTYITIAIAGDTTVNTYNTTNGFSLIVVFGLGASGASTGGTVNTWQNGNFTQPAGTVSVVSTNAATWYITGVQLEKGSTATSFDFRDYGTELALCQRYFTKTFPLATAPAQAASQNGSFICPQGAGAGANGNSYSLAWQFKVAMRTAPTIALYTPTAAGGGNWYDAGGFSTTTSASGNTSEFSTVIYNVSAAATANVNAVIHATASAEL